MSNAEQNCKCHLHHLLARPSWVLHSGHRQSKNSRCRPGILNTRGEMLPLLEQLEEIMKLFAQLKSLAFIQRSQPVSPHFSVSTFIVYGNFLTQKVKQRQKGLHSRLSPKATAAIRALEAWPHASYGQWKSYRHERGPQRATMKILCISAVTTIEVLFQGERVGITWALKVISLFHFPLAFQKTAGHGTASAQPQLGTQ